MTELKPFQTIGAKAIRKFNGRALLADEMGLGKTIQALYWCMRMKKARPILVICPASLKYNWQREALMHMGMGSVVLEGREPAKGLKISGQPITIINYEILPGWRKYIRKLNPSVIIIDECHYVKTVGTQRTENCRQICRQAKYLIALSGTPLTNCPAELWPTLNMLYPKQWDSFFAFAVKYSRPRRIRGRWQYKGAKNLPELHSILKKTCMIRRLKKDVMKELPAKSRFVVPVAIENANNYRRADADFLGWLGKQSKAKANKAKRAQAVVKMGYLRRLAVASKMKSVFNWIDNFLEESDGKLIVFMTHKVVMKQLIKRYEKIQVHIHGGVSTRKRQTAVDLFQRHPKKRLFFGNYKAAGVGWTLTAASTVLKVELDWVPANHTQAEDRAHRIGQHNSVNIYYLVAKGTIEEKLCAMLQDKQSVLDGTLDGIEGGSELDLKDELLKQLQKGL